MPIEVRQADGVSVVVINRPKWNLLDMEMIEQLSAAFERHDPEKPVVLAGEGDAFSAGVDTKAFAQYDARRRVELAQKITGMTARILAIRAPRRRRYSRTRHRRRLRANLVRRLSRGGGRCGCTICPWRGEGGRALSGGPDGNHPAVRSWQPLDASGPPPNQGNLAQVAGGHHA